MRLSLLILVLASLVACGSPGDDDDSAPSVIYAYPEADASDQEPNDSIASAQVLGSLESGFSLTGEAAACGDNGTWEGADTDWFSFAPATADPFVLRLEMWEGDLDLAVFSDGGMLLVDGAQAGLEPEQLSLALDPSATWYLRVRCWQGNPAALWRLTLR